jgi:hypothetical protein
MAQACQLVAQPANDQAQPLIEYSPRSAELISTAYQPWNSVFLSQQISHSRLISQKTACQTGLLFQKNSILLKWYSISISFALV